MKGQVLKSFWSQYWGLVCILLDVSKIKKLCLTCCAEELDDVLLAGLALVKGTCVGSERKQKVTLLTI